MNVLSWLIGSGVEATAKGTGEVLNGVGDAAIKLRTAITGDLPPEKKAEIELAVMQLENAILIGQNELNKLDAQSGSLFKGGWRPFIGWVCGISIATYFIPKHFLAAWIWVSLYWRTGALTPYPVSMYELLELTLAILGLAGLRTIEKRGK